MELIYFWYKLSNQVKITQAFSLLLLVILYFFCLDFGHCLVICPMLLSGHRTVLLFPRLIISLASLEYPVAFFSLSFKASQKIFHILRWFLQLTEVILLYLVTCHRPSHLNYLYNNPCISLTTKSLLFLSFYPLEPAIAKTIYFLDLPE